MKRVTTLTLAIHRVLGALLSALFLVWFLSGLVMIYHTFPKVNQADRRAKLEYLTAEGLPSPQELALRLPESERLEGMTLDRYLRQTVFHLRTGERSLDIPADSSESLPAVDGERIRQVAALWSQAPVEKIDSLYALDQWIPFGKLREDFPIYKFHFADPLHPELYISSKSGEVLQFTDRDSRFWAWLGAIPHWVYFTSVRQDAGLWIKVVIWLSGIGCVMCIAGIYLGIRDFRLARQRRRISPYKKFWYKWHHILGTVFGLSVLAFTFSGMMSLARVQDWGIRAKVDINPSRELLRMAPSPLDYPLDYREVIRAYPGKIRQIEWKSFGNVPFYTLHTDTADLMIDASSPTIRPLDLEKDTILSILSRIHGTGQRMRIEKRETYDTYYISRKRTLELPVWKATIADADHSSYYINPRSGEYRYVNDPSRWHHWMYPALHSLQIQFLVDRPVLWNLVMWGLMLGGMVVSLSGVWLGIKFLIRKIRKAFRKHPSP